MLKFIFPLLCALMLIGCSSNNIGENPTIDGQEMMFNALTELKDGNPKEANSIIGKYVNYYKSADKAKQIEFCNASKEEYWQKMLSENNQEWTTFLKKIQPLMQWYMESSDGLSSLNNFKELRQLQNNTLTE